MRDSRGNGLLELRLHPLALVVDQLVDILKDDNVTGLAFESYFLHDHLQVNQLLSQVCIIAGARLSDYSISSTRAVRFRIVDRPLKDALVLEEQDLVLVAEVSHDLPQRLEV